MRQIRNRASTRCSLHNLASQASFWVRDSHNNPFHTSIKPVLRVCFYAWKLWPLQTTQTPSSLWKQSSSFCCNSHPTQLRSQGLSICLLDFEPLFLMPDRASEGAKEPEASSVEEKKCFTSKSREQVVGKRGSCQDATCENRFFLSTQKREADFSEFSLHSQD